MAYMTIHQIEGNPDELLHVKSTKFDPVIDAIAPNYGAIVSLTAKNEDGLRIINVWKSPEDVKRFMNLPEVVSAQRESGLPMPSAFEKFDDTIDKIYQNMKPKAS